MNERINDRILQIMHEQRLTEFAFAKRLGHVGNSTISKITKGVKGKISLPGYETIMQIINTFGINPTWLMTGSGKMYEEEKQVESNGSALKIADYLRMYEREADRVTELLTLLGKQEKETERWRQMAMKKIKVIN